MNTVGEKRVSGNVYSPLQGEARRFCVFLLLSGLFFPGLAFGQWSRDNLNSNVASGGTVTVPTGVNFANTKDAVGIGKNTVLRGSTTNNLPTSIGNLSTNILNQINAQKTGEVGSLISLISGQVNAFGVPDMSFINGANFSRSVSDTSADLLNNKKWLNITNNTATLGLEYLHFKNVIVDYTYSNSNAGGVVNGLIGSASGNTKDISIDDVTGNAFMGIKVTLHGYSDKNYLAGGGVIGLRATGELGATSASASMNNITGNVFKGVTVVTDYYNGVGNSAYIEGGGIIGVDAVSSPAQKSGHASITSLTNNLFTDIKIRSNDIILGGGLVGVNNNSQNHNVDTYSEILAVSGNIFGNGNLNKADPENTADIYVKSVYSLRGGGVIGVNGLSNAAVKLDSLEKNIFAGIYVNTDSYLKGGGIIGVQSNDGGDGKLTPDTMLSVSAYLGKVQKNLFFNQQVDVGTYLSGGGIIGIRSNEGLVALDGLQDNIFKGLTVNVKGTGSNYLDGGGIIGASAKAEAAITNVRNNYFDDLAVNASGNLRGGGVLGASSSNIAASVVSGDASGVAEVDNVVDNTFSNITVTVGGQLSGGGIVGANGEVDGTNNDQNILAIIPTLTGNTFSDIKVKVTGDLLGGGVVGAHTDDNPGSGNATAGSTALSDNRFTNVDISAEDIFGGGIVGFHAEGDASAYMKAVSGNDFGPGKVTTTGNITGGGVLGVYSEQGIAWIDSVTNSNFYGLTITAGGYIDGGGIIGATGKTNAGENQITGIGRIDSSFFTGNKVTAQNGQILGGAVYSYGSFAEMTISDSGFFDNTFSSTCSSCDGDATAKVYGTVVVDTGLPGPDPKTLSNTLTLTATAGNSTWFRNNRITDGGGTRTNSLYFGAILDPENSYNADSADSDAHLIISPAKGGAVALYDPIEVNQDNDSAPDRKFAMTVQGAGEFFWGGNNVFKVGKNYSGDYAVDNKVLFKSGSNTTLLSGMTLDAEAHDVTLETGGRINVMGENRWKVKDATLNGHLHFNLNAATVNDANTALLTIITGSNHANIGGATVSLSNFTAGALLKAGDEFYLIETKTNDDLDDEPTNNTAYARQGMTRAYNFTVDKESHDTTQNRRLVARLVDAPFPAHETRILAEGRIAGLALLGQNANWLADHSYQQADLGLRRGENRAFFGGADFASVRIDTGSDVDYKGYTLVAGEAVKREKKDQSLLFGGFFEAGYGEYDVRGKFGHPEHPSMKGDGTMHYYGIGIMARQRWDKGFRLEASLRGGRQENKFRSRDLADADGEIAKYKLNVPWFGAHLGAGYEWQADEHNGFDTYLRYYWVRQNGKTVHLNKDREEVRFLNDNSHRVRAGGRYTRTRDVHNAWYLGLAYEYEFDHRTHARSADGKIDMPDPRGGSGVGEIGMILHPKNHDRLSIEFGLQGYAGQRKGVSGGARLGWKF